jgi:hypothetical protein
MDSRTRNSLITFLVLTFALSVIVYVWSFSGASLELVAPLLMWPILRRMLLPYDRLFVNRLRSAAPPPADD